MKHLNKKLSLLFASLAMLVVVGMSPVANAAGCVKTTVIPCTTTGGNAIIGLLVTIVNFLAFGVGLVVVGGIVTGAIVYITANGNAQQSQQGITYIVNAVIGLFLYIFLFAIMNFLVPGGLFN